MLWTLAGNPVRQWYQGLGGREIGEKSYLVDDWRVVEVGYGWPDIRSLCGADEAGRRRIEARGGEGEK